MSGITEITKERDVPDIYIEAHPLSRPEKWNAYTMPRWAAPLKNMWQMAGQNDIVFKEGIAAGLRLAKRKDRVITCPRDLEPFYIDAMGAKAENRQKLNAEERAESYRDRLNGMGANFSS